MNIRQEYERCGMDDPCKGCNSYIPYYTHSDYSSYIEEKLCAHLQDQKLRGNEIDLSFLADCPCINCIVKCICDRNRKLNWSSYSCNGKTENYFFCKAFFDCVYEHAYELIRADG